jgi:molybdopterin-biosynthesis enzyme MoeA-like protein
MKLVSQEVKILHVYDEPSPACCCPGLLQVLAIPDDVHLIAAEVSAASSAHDVVITCGGVGPTLDDVTMAGVARALGVPVTR